MQTYNGNTKRAQNGKRLAGKKNREPDHGDHQEKNEPRVESIRVGHVN
jgi:hypothetical protein